VTPLECFRLAGARVADPSLLRRVTPKDIVKRMLQNLHSGYLERRDWARGVATLDLLILATPPGARELAGAHKRRGLLLLELKRYHDARRDLEKYLALEPQAADGEEIRKQIAAIHRWLARVN
jgi:regulator of sirC expression with transglutaminase-like and TPR domain